MTSRFPGLTVLRRARIAVHLLFLLDGTAIGVWTARIPAVKERLALSDGQFSLALFAMACGSIVGMQVVGRLVDRYGSAAVMIPGGALLGLALIPLAYAPGLAALSVCLFVFGALWGTMNVSMNANAVQVERGLGRPVMSSFHAFYSVGGFAGAGLGGLFAHAGIGVGPTFLTAAAALILLAAWSHLWALRTRPEPERHREPAARDGNVARGVLLLGVLGFFCMIGEGAAADWSSVYLREDLGSSPGFAATAYAAFSIMMTAGRLAGDALAARFGPVALVRCCGLLAGTGLAAALVIGHPVAGVIGFGCFGAGLSCIVPQVFSAAGHRDPAQAGRALARVASVGYAGFLLGPVVIGQAAELTGLPRALAIPALLALLVALAAPALKPR